MIEIETAKARITEYFEKRKVRRPTFFEEAESLRFQWWDWNVLIEKDRSTITLTKNDEVKAMCIFENRRTSVEKLSCTMWELDWL